MQCAPGHHIVECSWASNDADGAPPPGISCVCGAFRHIGDWQWVNTDGKDFNTLDQSIKPNRGRCPICTVAMDDHPRPNCPVTL